MSIALPPPPTPQQATLEQLRPQAQQELLLDYHGYRIHLFGDPVSARVVDPERLRRAVSEAATLSDAVRSIGYLHYTAGYPATLLSYALVPGGKDLYVRVARGHVAQVRGPPRYTGYFDALKHQPELTAAGLEAGRELADGLSERAGEKLSPTLLPLGGNAVALDLGEPAPAGHQTAAAASFSNYGNRYSGPYLAEAAFRQSFSSGDELSLSGSTGVRALGLGGNRSEPYHEGDGGWSRVTALGVFALQGRYASFRQTVQGVPLDGTLDTVQLSWLMPLYADFQRRLNLTAQLDRNEETLDAGTAGGELLAERYGSAQALLAYTQRIQHGERQSELQARLTLRKGLGRDSSALTPASQAYLSLRPAVGLRYGLAARWTLGAEVAYQFADRSLPQQEQWVIGGPASLHAWQSGVAVGDRGGNARLALEWKDSGDSWIARHQVQPRLFVEYGETSLARKTLGENSGAVSLADAGADLGLHFTRWLEGSVSAAAAFHEHGASNNPDGLARKTVFFRLAARY